MSVSGCVCSCKEVCRDRQREGSGAVGGTCTAVRVELVAAVSSLAYVPAMAENRSTRSERLTSMTKKPLL